MWEQEQRMPYGSPFINWELTGESLLVLLLDTSPNQKKAVEGERTLKANPAGCHTEDSTIWLVTDHVILPLFQ